VYTITAFKDERIISNTPVYSIDYTLNPLLYIELKEGTKKLGLKAFVFWDSIYLLEYLLSWINVRY
jgi:hypothetical protein